MIKKLILITSIFLSSYSYSYSYAQTAPIDISKGITVKQLNDAFSSKIDTNRIGAANGVAGLDENGNITSPLFGSTMDTVDKIPNLISCPIGSCPSLTDTLGPVNSLVNLQSKTSKTTGQGEMTLNVGMLVDTGNSSGATTYGKLPLYVGMMQTTGAGTAWAFNTNAIRNAVPGGSNSINGLPGSGTPGTKGAIGNVSTYGYENDLTNWDEDVDTSNANIIEYYGHMQGTYRSTAYFNMDATMPSGIYGAKYGMVWQPNTVSDILINDNTNSTTGILFSAINSNANIEIDGNGNTGLYFKGTKSLDDILIDNSTPISISISGNHTSSSINDISTTPSALNLSGTYSLSAINTQSSNSSEVLVMKIGQNICYNGSDNCLSVGPSSNQLSYTVGGKIQFSITQNGETIENISHPKILIIPSATLSTLPSSPSIGMAYIVTDGRKPGESSGAGSGAYCVYDGKEWMNVSTGVEVTN